MTDCFETCRYPTASLCGCPNRTTEHSQYCEEHVCGFRGCAQMKQHGFSYCTQHKCSSPSCGELKQSAASVSAGTWSRMGLGMADAGAMFPGVVVSPFCARHSCRRDGCISQAGRDQFFCAAHKCCVPGCRSEATNAPISGAGDIGGTCDAHFRGSGGGFGPAGTRVPYPFADLRFPPADYGYPGAEYVADRMTGGGRTFRPPPRFWGPF